MANHIGLDTAVEVHFDLVQFFTDGHCTTSEEISRRYGIGRRTAQRYLERIDRYVPLQRNGPNWRKAALR